MVQAIKEFRGLILLLFLCIGVSSLNAGNKTKTSISTDIAALDSLKPIDNFTFELDEVESEYVTNQIIRDSYDVAYRIVEGKEDAPSGARLVYRALNLSAAYTDAKWPEKIRNKCIVIVTQDGVPTHAFLTSPGSRWNGKSRSL